LIRDERAGTVGMPARMSRRSLLKNSLGAAVLVAAPEYLLPRTGRAATAAPAAASHFFLYGVLDPTADRGPSIQAGRPEEPGPPRVRGRFGAGRGGPLGHHADEPPHAAEARSADGEHADGRERDVGLAPRPRLLRLPDRVVHRPVRPRGRTVARARERRRQRK